MSVEQMKKAAAMGAKLEIDAMGPLMGPNAHLAWMRHWRQVTHKESASHIKEVGAQNFVLGTDLGQTGNPSQPDGYGMLVGGLMAEGISKEQILTMGREVPGKLLMGSCRPSSRARRRRARSLTLRSRGRFRPRLRRYASQAAGDLARVPLHAFEIVEDRQIDGRRARHADAVDQTLLVNAGEVPGEALEGSAVLDDVADEHAVFGDEDVSHALDQLEGLCEQRLHLAHRALAEGHALRDHRAHGSNQQLDVVAHALEMHGDDEEIGRSVFGVRDQRLLQTVNLVAEPVSPLERPG